MKKIVNGMMTKKGRYKKELDDNIGSSSIFFSLSVVENMS